jgi:hypothetical protein
MFRATLKMEGVRYSETLWQMFTRLHGVGSQILVILRFSQLPQIEGYPDDGGSAFLRTECEYLLDCTASRRIT